jgi:hypothetical protein
MMKLFHFAKKSKKHPAPIYVYKFAPMITKLKITKDMFYCAKKPIVNNNYIYIIKMMSK